MNPSTIIALVQGDLFEREKRGLNKYGTTVDRKDLTEEQWLQHAYEEALDLAVYLKKTIQSKKGIEEIKHKPKREIKVGDAVKVLVSDRIDVVEEIDFTRRYPYKLRTCTVYQEDELELIE